MGKSHELFESYLTSTSLVQQQIDSYNRFINIGIQRVVESQSLIEPEVSDFAIKFEGIRLEQPRLIEADSSVRRILPIEALARNLTYAAPMYLTYTPMVSGIAKKDAAGEVFVGELPVMVKSELCYTKGMTREQLVAEGEDPDDPGGFFIIKGVERVLIGIEDLAPNRILCSKDDEEVTARVISTSLVFKSRCTVTRDAYGIYTILFPTAAKDVDIILILKALGMKPEDIMESSANGDVKNDLLLNMDISRAKEMTEAEALEELGRMSAPNQPKAYQQKRGGTQLDTYILPHLGTTQAEREAKAKYILHMAERASPSPTATRSRTTGTTTRTRGSG